MTSCEKHTIPLNDFIRKIVGAPWKAGGRDYDGVDCYGLVRLVYRDVAGVELPPLNGLYVTAEEREDIARIVEGEVTHGPWVQVEAGDERDLDVALFRCFGRQSHVGVICGRGLMLHATMGQAVAIERYTGPRWVTRFESAWRHKILL